MTIEPSQSEPKEPSASLPAPTIGRYKVIGRLGKGGMAEVLLTLQHDETSGFKRLVVVKRVLADLEEADAQFVKMFLDEARLAARLSHPNVVQTYEVGQEGASPFLAMEFLDGQSLNVLQRRAYVLKKPVPVDATLRVIADALEGLHYAHELKDFDGTPLGVIHRDVTPSNIFVKYDGTTKLVDFGIAKSATQREKTRAGVLKGKMAYMAPEQLRDETITRSVDVWAMGVVLWETLAGERLFRGKNDLETVQAVMKRQVPKLAEMRPDVPKAVDALLAQAIERNPAKRFQTAEEMKLKLEEIAFEVGKPIRRNDVAKVMAEFFGEAVEHNQKMIKEFLEKAASDITPQSDEVLRFRTTGELVEARPRKDTDPSRPSATLTEVEPVRPASETPTRAAKGKGKGGDDERTVVDARAPAAEATGTATRVDVVEAADEDEPRPLWHWAVLLLALAGVSVAVWRILAT